MIRLVLGKDKSPLKILCLGAHCDDIEIGCGGTMLRLIEDYRGNVIVHWAVFSANAERRKEALGSAQALLKRLKQKTMTIEGFDDSFFPYKNAAEIKEYLHRLSRGFSPDLIFTHHGKDLHQDHRLISELTWNAFRDNCILEYEIPKYDGDLGHPNVFIPLDESICRTKINHLIHYFKSQRHRNWFTKDTFMSLLRLRGVECNSISGYAEAFHCRKIVL